MIEKTIYGISKALGDAFGAEYAIHLENIEQNVMPPSFLIKPLVHNRQREVGNRYRQEQSFDIHYFPLDEDGILECTAVLSRLYDVLEYIIIDDDLVWGTNLHGEITDGVLHFSVNYDLFLVKKKETNRMENAAIKVMERME